jgi:hypothetical protein
MDTFTFNFVAAHTYTFATRMNMNRICPTIRIGGKDCTSTFEEVEVFLLLEPFDFRPENGGEDDAESDNISVLNISMFAREISDRYCLSMSTSPRRLTMNTAERAIGGGGGRFIFYVLG